MHTYVWYDGSSEQSGGGEGSISQTSWQRRPDEDIMLREEEMESVCVYTSTSGVSRGVFWLPGNPPPPGHDFFLIRGFTSLHAPTFTSHLNLRLLETPLETNSGYATEHRLSAPTHHRHRKILRPVPGALRFARLASRVCESIGRKGRV